MKKLLTVLAITAIAMTSMFAKSAQVQLINTIDETQVSYELTYNNELIKDGTDEYSIKVLPLTEAGETEMFRVHASSNMNSDLSVKVKVKPESFKTTLNSGDDKVDSKITPEVKQSDFLDILKAGLNKNVLVNEFLLQWNGDADLPAGDYVSNVRIEYTIK